MIRKRIFPFLLMLLALLLGGCALLTVDEMYVLPKRSEEASHLQTAIEEAMAGLEYAAPISGENQQTVQMADLTGDGESEYILFARNTTDKSLHILIFTKVEEAFLLFDRIECTGFAFEQAEYVPIDDRAGYELVVGRQLNDGVLRSVAVYSFAHGTAEQLLGANYVKYLTCDLDLNGKAELMLIQPEQSKSDNAVAVHYSFVKGAMERSREAKLSSSADAIKRIMVSYLDGGEPAVYVASLMAESAIITDIFALKNGEISNISYSAEAGTSVRTLRNYYIYADDIDNDGILELPSLITMKPYQDQKSGEQQYLIRWFSMDMEGNEVEKGFTYHNFQSGWYVSLDKAMSSRISVRQTGAQFTFYIWDEDYTKAERLLTISALTGADREVAAMEDGRFMLRRTDGVIYAAVLDAQGASDYGITQEKLIDNFHLIRQDWKTGET